jgi:hypothetical protein
MHDVSRVGSISVFVQCIDGRYLFLFKDFFSVEKGPAAEATDAPQPSGLLCNTVMKMRFFLLFYFLMEHRWNEIERGKPKYSEKNLSQFHFVHHKSHMD